MLRIINILLGRISLFRKSGSFVIEDYERMIESLETIPVSETRKLRVDYTDHS